MFFKSKNFFSWKRYVGSTFSRKLFSRSQWTDDGRPTDNTFFSIKKPTNNSRPRRMPLTFSGHSCLASTPGGVNGQHKKPSHVALQKPKIEKGILLQKKDVFSFWKKKKNDKTKKWMKSLSRPLTFLKHVVYCLVEWCN